MGVERIMIKSRKAVIEPFPLLIGVMGAAILLTLVSILMADYAQLKIINPEPLGGKAVEVLDAYQEGDDALAYLDNAAKQSMEQAIHYAGQHGFKIFRRPDFRYVYWTQGNGYWNPDEMSCWPTPKLINLIPGSYDPPFKYYFKNFGLNKHVDSFNDLEGPNLTKAEKYQLTLSRIDLSRSETDFCSGFCGIGSGLDCRAEGCVQAIPHETLKLVGTTREPVVVDYEKFDYNVTPSFTQTINVDYINDFKVVQGNMTKFWRDVDTEELRDKGVDLIESMLPMGQQEHLLWSIDGVYGGPFGAACHTDDCSYTREENCRDECDTEEPPNCETVCDCNTYTGTRTYYWTTTTAKISANITTPEVYFWNYFVSPVEKEKYSYKFALNWMSGAYSVCRPYSEC